MWNRSQLHFARPARGLTLVEMLMATALSLIMFAAVAQIFQFMGNSMRRARATIELSGNLRSVRNHLQGDLNNLSVDVLPWVKPGTNQGYFEIIEGPDRDVDFASFDLDTTLTGLQGALAGDGDDTICFTAFSKTRPFVGRIYGNLVARTPTAANPYPYYIDRSSGNFTTITSHYAEIVYFTKLTSSDDIQQTIAVGGLPAGVDGQRDPTETVTLYRRVFLIRPDIYLGDPSTMNLGTSYTLTDYEARNYYDLSMRGTASTQWVTNSLEDLQTRLNRIGHNTLAGSTYPHPLQPAALLSFEQLNNVFTANSTTNLLNRTGEDVILTKCLAFDVRVFDPYALSLEEKTSGTIVVDPTDVGFNVADTATFANSNYMTGAFVDLNWLSRYPTYPSPVTGYTNSVLGGTPATYSQLSGITANSAKLYGTAPANFAALAAVFNQIPSRLQASGETTPNLAHSYAYYDTWPYIYEVDGADNNGNGATDEGTDGFDSNGDGRVDNSVEFETSPPYPVPLRGISVTVRAYEPGTRQVRQDTIVTDFLPD
ncbi:hypothetical protein GC197_07305 [bacterium]|nr:hypothetical protein [bacterium]